MGEDKPDMTIREAARRGGQRTKERHGAEHFSRAGKLGGKALSEKRGREFYREIGAKGRQRTRALIEAGKKALGEAE